MTREIYCDSCGAEIHDLSTCKMYKAGDPYYETIYICEDCASSSDNSDEMTHVDMDCGEAL